MAEGSVKNHEGQTSTIARCLPIFGPSFLIEGGLCTRKAGCTLRRGAFLPSKHLLSAFYETLPSKNPSKNLTFTESPYRHLLRTLLRSVLLHDPLGVHPRGMLNLATPKKVLSNSPKGFIEPLKRFYLTPKGSVEPFFCPQKGSIESQRRKGLQNHRQGSIEHFASNPSFSCYLSELSLFVTRSRNHSHATNPKFWTRETGDGVTRFGSVRLWFVHRTVQTVPVFCSDGSSRQRVFAAFCVSTSFKKRAWIWVPVSVLEKRFRRFRFQFLEKPFRRVPASGSSLFSVPP